MSDNIEKNAKKPKAFPYHKLRGNCRELFGVSASTFDGATFQMDKGGSYTVDETKKTITTWLGRSVK